MLYARAGIEVRTGTTALGYPWEPARQGGQLANVDAKRRRDRRAPSGCGCDALLMSGGYTPSVHLHSQARGKLRWDDSSAGLRSRRDRRRMPLRRRLQRIARGTAGRACSNRLRRRRPMRCAQCGLTPSAGSDPCQPTMPALPAAGSAHCRSPRDGAAGKAFVDWQNDVTAADLALARARRLPLDRAHQALHDHRHGDRPGQDLEPECAGDRGTAAGQGDSRSRPDYVPPALPAGGFRRPRRRMRAANSSRRCARRRCTTGPRRAAPCSSPSRCGSAPAISRERGEDMHQAVRRECEAVRRSCGIFDASTLGKIEVAGPDAIEFMNRMYVNNWSSLGRRPLPLRHPVAR